MLVRICVITYIAFFSPCDVANFHPKMKIRSLSGEVNLSVKHFWSFTEKKEKECCSVLRINSTRWELVLKCKIRPEK